MTFTFEDKAAWNSSEIMAELEKIAHETDLLKGPSSDAFEPIKENDEEDDGWEDEDFTEDKPEPFKHSDKVEEVLIALESLAKNLESENKNLEAEKIISILQEASQTEKTVDIFYLIKGLAKDFFENNKVELADVVINMTRSLFNIILEENQKKGS